jgi:hypothetical protein
VSGPSYYKGNGTVKKYANTSGSNRDRVPQITSKKWKNSLPSKPIFWNFPVYGHCFSVLDAQSSLEK